MPNILDGLTEREQKLARGMAAAIWGIDVDEVQQVPAESACNKVIFPEVSSRPLKWYDDDDPLGLLRPRYTTFTSATVELDRWLVPWRLWAGYSAEINMLVYRLEAA